ncbi:MAG TPA: Thivi_2564 family membrane protein [Bryobacteraceae bacterium]|nr:Thivi_2564 family membrane protein [Bryobacteraceae bacterium]
MMQLAYLIVALIVVIVIAWLVNRYITFPTNVRTILNIVLGLIVVGMGLWLINTYVPMAGSIRAILNIVVFLAACVGVLQAVGLWSRVVAMWNDLIHGRLHSDHNHVSMP